MAKRLQSLSVSGFKALSDVHIPRLADINLFVGKNNAGKTTILEAISLLLCRDLRTRLYALLVERGELSVNRWQNNSRRASLSVTDPSFSVTDVSFEALFNGRPELTPDLKFKIFGEQDDPDLEIGFVWLRQERREDASVTYLPSNGPEVDIDAIPGFSIRRKSLIGLLPLDRINRMFARRASREVPDTNVVFIRSSGMSMEEIGKIWDSVALTDDEDHVVEALRIIVPSLEKLVMIQSPESRSERVLMAKVAEFRWPVPFKSLGEGALHLLSIALATIHARGSMLLIDEIASAIHYSVQPKIWELIYRQTQNYDVQVFATTHSWDCVRALHRSDGGPDLPQAALHRLERSLEAVKVVSFFGDELQTIDAEEIEVR